MSPRRILLPSVTLLCALALAACGGGSDTKSTTAATGASSNTTAPSGTVSGSNATADAAATTSPDFKGSGSGNLCDYAKDIESSQALENAFSGKTDTKTLKDGFTTALAIMDTAISKAPSEIKADLQTLQKGFKAFADFYASYDYDSLKLAAAMQKDPTLASKLQTLDSTDFTAASDRVNAYFEKVCGIKSS